MATVTQIIVLYSFHHDVRINSHSEPNCPQVTHWLAVSAEIPSPPATVTGETSHGQSSPASSHPAHFLQGLFQSFTYQRLQRADCILRPFQWKKQKQCLNVIYLFPNYSAVFLSNSLKFVKAETLWGMAMVLVTNLSWKGLAQSSKETWPGQGCPYTHSLRSWHGHQ